MYASELYHHGVKGQKWGRRRYQNPDGSLTAEGQKRYARDAREKDWTMGEDGVARSGGKKNRKVQDPDPDRWVTEDVYRSKKVADSGKDLTRNLNDLNRTTTGKGKREQMNLDNMTDKEMRDQIQRELLERQYNDVFNPPKVKKGREYATRTLEVAGSVLGVTASALGIALAIRDLRG